LIIKKPKFTEKELKKMDWANCLDLLNKIDLKEFSKFRGALKLTAYRSCSTWRIDHKN